MATTFLPPRICLIPRLHGLGGPSSFNKKLIKGLNARGIQVGFELSDPDIRAILVNGGTRRSLLSLWQAHRRGIRIVQRLDGMNWIHRKTNTGLPHFLRSELNNATLAIIRRWMANAIIYQSEFTQGWWNRVYGPLQKPFAVVHNAVDLSFFTPGGPGDLPEDHVVVQCVEGHLRGGNEAGLQNAIQFAHALGAELLSRGDSRLPVELRVVADVPMPVRDRFTRLYPDTSHARVNYAGIVPHPRIPELSRSAHLFYSAELNAPCPNSVIEALACGLPVVGFQTGSLPELVHQRAGVLAPYGADPWSLDPPLMAPLAKAAADLLADLAPARRAARSLAETAFGVDRMVDAYLDVLLEKV